MGDLESGNGIMWQLYMLTLLLHSDVTLEVIPMKNVFRAWQKLKGSCSLLCRSIPYF